MRVGWAFSDYLKSGQLSRRIMLRYDGLED